MIHRPLKGREIHFYIEPTLPDYLHPCTPEDVMRVLQLLPTEHLNGLEAFVFRQPTRRQTKLTGVWGLWRLCDALGPIDRHWYAEERGYTEYDPTIGPCLFLEAQPIGNRFRWSRKLDPDDSKELERLEADGHHIEGDKRFHYIRTTPDTCRSTMLYRTLPHELGHHVDYMRNVGARAKGEEDWNRLAKLYWSHPASEREAFAHRYADEFREKQFREGKLPFERIFSREELKAGGLEPEWFEAG